MKRLIQIALILIASLPLSAQVTDSLNQEVAPANGLNSLAIKYYGIEFTKAQRSYLKDKEVEFVFLIDKFGQPTLSEVNGISDPAIIDSLKSKTTEIDHFKPYIKNGVAKSSIYFMQLMFPTYKINPQRMLSPLHSIRSVKYSDFEYINKSNARLDMLLGVAVNQFFGRPADYLKLGAGMISEFSLTTDKQYIWGITMGIYSNKFKKDYPIQTSQVRFDIPPTILFGVLAGKWLTENVNIQSEICYSVQNITERNNKDWVQFQGWSPGIVLNYSHRFGKERVQIQSGWPTVLSNNINLHLGARYLILSLDEATGLMMELGLSYRLGRHRVTDFKLKPEFN